MFIENDGIDHINISYLGKTALGKFLANSTKYQIETEDGIFQSVEGYWYWLLSPPTIMRDCLKTLHGKGAKDVGKELFSKNFPSNEKIEDQVFRTKIKKAIANKIYTSDLLEEFRLSKLPFSHYYIKKNKIKPFKLEDWVIDYINGLRSKLY